MISFFYNILNWDLKKSFVIGGLFDIFLIVGLVWSVL